MEASSQVFAFAAFLTVAIIGWLSYKAGRTDEAREIRQEDMGGIREFQELIGKVKNETTRDSEEFRKRKEAYYAKYRRSTDKPTNGDPGDSAK